MAECNLTPAVSGGATTPATERLMCDHPLDRVVMPPPADPTRSCRCPTRRPIRLVANSERRSRFEARRTVPGLPHVAACALSPAHRGTAIACNWTPQQLASEMRAAAPHFMTSRATPVRAASQDQRASSGELDRMNRTSNRRGHSNDRAAQAKGLELLPRVAHFYWLSRPAA